MERTHKQEKVQPPECNGSSAGGWIIATNACHGIPTTSFVRTKYASTKVARGCRSNSTCFLSISLSNGVCCRALVFVYIYIILNDGNVVPNLGAVGR